jgi:transposase InsO family protein
MLQASKSPSLQVRACEVEGVSLLSDVSMGRLRPLVAEADRPLVFEAIHGVAHPGICVTRRMIAARFLWPGMQSYIATWCRSCVVCQRAKVTRQPRAPVQPIAIPKRRFSHVHVDLVGPLPVSAEGYMYLLTMIDRTTRWLEATPLKESASCVEAFLSNWVAHFGVPETLTSDRGAQFSSSTWASFCSKLGVRHAMTTAYHPQANGLVERDHRQLKDGLRVCQAGVDWPAHLPWVLLGLRAAPKEISGVFSRGCFRTASDPAWRDGFPPGDRPTDFLDELSSPTPPTTCQPRTYAEVAAQPPNWRLQLASMVHVKKGGCSPPLAPAYVGPYKAVRPGPKFFVLEVGGLHVSVSVDRLKPHLGTFQVCDSLTEL